LWSTCVKIDAFTYNEQKGRRAVLEEPFLAFYIESDIEPESMNKITPQYLETIDDSLIKFAGFQTWGSGKGDDATSGYDEETPGYLLLEGAENNGKLPNFLMPWSPDCIKLSKDTLVTLEKTSVDNVGEFDSFDVNFGVTEIEKDKLYEFNEV
jgi:hypothetical protein